MNTKAALILSLALIISTMLYCFGTRYQMVMDQGESRVNAYMYDRITGKSWWYLQIGYQISYLPTLSPQEREERRKQQSQGPNKLRGRDKIIDDIDKAVQDSSDDKFGKE
jgi:hypothetical protein